MVVCAAINWERTRNLSSKVASCGYNLLISFSRRIYHSKTDLNDINFLALYWKCACVGPIFFNMYSQNVFIQGSSLIYKVRSSTVDSKNNGDLPKEVHNVFEVTELCHTRADILGPTLDQTLVASQITKI